MDANNQLPILTPPATTAIDPVCGMTVDTAHARGTAEYNGKTYYFCSPGCVTKFKADPEKYLQNQGASPMKAPGSGMVMLGAIGAAKAAPNGTKYVCPMDPEVVSEKPGACPKCGMALEPDTPPTA